MWMSVPLSLFAGRRVREIVFISTFCFCTMRQMCVYRLLYCQQSRKTLQEAPGLLLGATANWSSYIRLNNNHVSIFLWFLLAEQGVGRAYIGSFNPSILEEKLSKKRILLRKMKNQFTQIWLKRCRSKSEGRRQFDRLQVFNFSIQIPFRNLTRLHH